MSFDIALSGIQAINEALETTSNNIANAATYGFKSSRANFSSVYAGTQANGVEVGSLTQSIGQNGSPDHRPRPRRRHRRPRLLRQPRSAGRHDLHPRRHLLDRRQGRLPDRQQRQDGAGLWPDQRRCTGHRWATSRCRPARSRPWRPPRSPSSATCRPTGSAPTTAPLNPADSSTYNMVKQSIVYDSLGTQHTVSQYFVKTAATPSTCIIPSTALPPRPRADPDLRRQGPADRPRRRPRPPLRSLPAAAARPPAASPSTTPAPPSSPAKPPPPPTAATATPRAPSSASNWRRTVRWSPSTATTRRRWSAPWPSPPSPTKARCSRSATPAGPPTPAPAAALYNTPGVGLSGKLTTGALEGSNVDITSELVGLMTSQRNYQANSKVLSTENQMMQSLMQAL
jgi:flagellar hook protein FlgE